MGGKKPSQIHFARDLRVICAGYSPRLRERPEYIYVYVYVYKYIYIYMFVKLNDFPALSKHIILIKASKLMITILHIIYNNETK